MDCIFCRIIRGEVPSFKIYEDKNFYACLDISQFTRGHTILIPKKHIQYIWEIPEGGAYFTTAQKIANHFRSLGFPYVDSLSFGRLVPHAHLHLIPHKDEPGDFKKALEKIGAMQGDPSRRPTMEEGKKIVEEFGLHTPEV